jgi:hypothetical protein
MGEANSMEGTIPLDPPKVMGWLGVNTIAIEKRVQTEGLGMGKLDGSWVGSFNFFGFKQTTSLVTP